LTYPQNITENVLMLKLKLPNFKKLKALSSASIDVLHGIV